MPEETTGRAPKRPSGGSKANAVRSRNCCNIGVGTARGLGKARFGPCATRSCKALGVGLRGAGREEGGRSGVGFVCRPVASPLPAGAASTLGIGKAAEDHAARAGL